ncbi:hypothetical protein J6590_089110 [Homalodisca vitripennis]|nr:hypothetical protein J6590_089110 [Homalodisca vitripennis]
MLQREASQSRDPPHTDIHFVVYCERRYHSRTYIFERLRPTALAGPCTEDAKARRPLRPARSGSLQPTSAHCYRPGPSHTDLPPPTATGSVRLTPAYLHPLRPARPGSLRPTAHCDRPGPFQPSPAHSGFSGLPPRIAKCTRPSRPARPCQLLLRHRRSSLSLTSHYVDLTRNCDSWILDINLKREECGEFAYLFPDLLQDLVGINVTNHFSFSKGPTQRLPLLRVRSENGKTLDRGIPNPPYHHLTSGILEMSKCMQSNCYLGGCPFDCVYSEFKKRPGRAGPVVVGAVLKPILLGHVT